MATATGLNLDSAELKKSIERFQSVREDILTQVRQVIVGQEDVLDQILLSLFVGGHCLITGLPGTAKTLMVRTISPDARLGFQAHSVHARPDARRHHRHGHHRGRFHHRPSPMDLCSRAHFWQHPARR